MTTYADVLRRLNIARAEQLSAIEQGKEYQQRLEQAKTVTRNAQERIAYEKAMRDRAYRTREERRLSEIESKKQELGEKIGEAEENLDKLKQQEQDISKYKAEGWSISETPQGITFTKENQKDTRQLSHQLSQQINTKEELEGLTRNARTDYYDATYIKKYEDQVKWLQTHINKGEGVEGMTLEETIAQLEMSKNLLQRYKRWEEDFVSGKYDIDMEGNLVEPEEKAYEAYLKKPWYTRAYETAVYSGYRGSQSFFDYGGMSLSPQGIGKMTGIVPMGPGEYRKYFYNPTYYWQGELQRSGLKEGTLGQLKTVGSYALQNPYGQIAATAAFTAYAPTMAANVPRLSKAATYIGLGTGVPSYGVSLYKTWESEGPVAFRKEAMFGAGLFSLGFGGIRRVTARAPKSMGTSYTGKSISAIKGVLPKRIRSFVNKFQRSPTISKYFRGRQLQAEGYTRAKEYRLIAREAMTKKGGTKTFGVEQYGKMEMFGGGGKKTWVSPRERNAFYAKQRKIDIQFPREFKATSPKSPSRVTGIIEATDVVLTRKFKIGPRRVISKYVSQRGTLYDYPDQPLSLGGKVTPPKPRTISFKEAPTVKGPTKTQFAWEAQKTAIKTPINVKKPATESVYQRSLKSMSIEGYGVKKAYWKGYQKSDWIPGTEPTWYDTRPKTPKVRGPKSLLSIGELGYEWVPQETVVKTKVGQGSRVGFKPMEATIKVPIEDSAFRYVIGTYPLAAQRHEPISKIRRIEDVMRIQRQEQTFKVPQITISQQKQMTRVQAPIILAPRIVRPKPIVVPPPIIVESSKRLKKKKARATKKRTKYVYSERKYYVKPFYEPFTSNISKSKYPIKGKKGKGAKPMFKPVKWR